MEDDANKAQSATIPRSSKKPNPRPPKRKMDFFLFYSDKKMMEVIVF
jgi:hypothetical protein